MLMICTERRQKPDTRKNAESLSSTNEIQTFWEPSSIKSLRSAFAKLILGGFW